MKTTVTLQDLLHNFDFSAQIRSAEAGWIAFAVFAPSIAGTAPRAVWVWEKNKQWQNHDEDGILWVFLQKNKWVYQPKCAQVFRQRNTLKGQ